jgi:hypothetical protein
MRGQGHVAGCVWARAGPLLTGAHPDTHPASCATHTHTGAPKLHHMHPSCSIPTGEMYVCGIELDHTNRAMLVCGLGGPSARVAVFDTRPGQPYTHRWAGVDETRWLGEAGRRVSMQTCFF